MYLGQAVPPTSARDIEFAEAYRRGFDRGRAAGVVQDEGEVRAMSKRQYVLAFGTLIAGLSGAAAVIASRKSSDAGDLFAAFAVASGIAVAGVAAVRVLLGDRTPALGL